MNRKIRYISLHLEPGMARAGMTVYSGETGKFKGKLIKTYERWAWILWERDARPTTCELSQVYRGVK